jgi:hypothetical protein
MESLLLPGTINYDGWDKKLLDIRDGDKELVLKFRIAMSATSLGSRGFTHYPL